MSSQDTQVMLLVAFFFQKLNTLYMETNREGSDKSHHYCRFSRAFPALTKLQEDENSGKKQHLASLDSCSLYALKDQISKLLCVKL